MYTSSYTVGVISKITAYLCKRQMKHCPVPPVARPVVVLLRVVAVKPELAAAGVPVPSHSGKEVPKGHVVYY